MAGLKQQAQPRGAAGRSAPVSASVPVGALQRFLAALKAKQFEAAKVLAFRSASLPLLLSGAPSPCLPAATP